MGSALSCVQASPSVTRVDYDLSALKSLPIIWLTGPPGSGRKTQGDLLQENLSYENIKVTQLLRNESTKDSKRGQLISEAIRNRIKKIPDTVVIDLIKEAILESIPKSKGFVINSFPKSPKQAELFVKEIGDVSIILYLHSDTQLLVERVQQKINGRLSNDSIRSKIDTCTKEIKESLSKYNDKIEKIETNQHPIDVFEKILEVFNQKLKPDVVSEMEYAQEPETSGQLVSHAN